MLVCECTVSLLLICWMWWWTCSFPRVTYHQPKRSPRRRANQEEPRETACGTMSITSGWGKKVTETLISCQNPDHVTTNAHYSCLHPSKIGGRSQIAQNSSVIMSIYVKIWIRLPRHNLPKSWSTVEDPVVPLERHLYRHPLAGLLWVRQFEKFCWTWMRKKYRIRSDLFVHRKQGSLSWVCVDDIKMAGRKQNMTPMCKKLMKLVDLDEILTTYTWDALNALTWPGLLTQIWMWRKKAVLTIFWNIDVDRNLPDSWTGFTGGGLQKNLQLQDLIFWCLKCGSMSKAAQKKEKHEWAIEKPKIENARRWWGIYFIDPEDGEYRETIKIANKKFEIPMEAVMLCKMGTKMRSKKLLETASESDESNKIQKTKLACIVEAHESTRRRLEPTPQKDHEDHIAEKDCNSKSDCARKVASVTIGQGREENGRYFWSTEESKRKSTLLFWWASVISKKMRS